MKCLLFSFCLIFSGNGIATAQQLYSYTISLLGPAGKVADKTDIQVYITDTTVLVSTNPNELVTITMGFSNESKNAYILAAALSKKKGLYVLTGDYPADTILQAKKTFAVTTLSESGNAGCNGSATVANAMLQVSSGAVCGLESTRLKCSVDYRYLLGFKDRNFVHTINGQKVKLPYSVLFLPGALYESFTATVAGNKYAIRLVSKRSFTAADLKAVDLKEFTLEKGIPGQKMTLGFQ